MEIVVAQTKDDVRRYDDFVENHGASIYYSRVWGQCVSSVYRYSYLPLMVEDGGQVIAIMPVCIKSLLPGFAKKLVVLPFSHHVPLLLADIQFASDACRLVGEFVKSLGISSVLLKNAEPIAGLQSYDSGYLVSRLSLDPGMAHVRKGYATAVKRGIKKATQSGVEVFRNGFDEFQGVFYDLMVETRRRQGVPVYPKAHFSLLKDLFDDNSLELWGAHYQGQMISGIVINRCQSATIYLYGASRDNQEVMTLRPNNLLFDHVIADCESGGVGIFDFGISHRTNEGLIRFKESWGATSEPVYYSNTKGAASSGQMLKPNSFIPSLAGRVFRSMPLAVYRYGSPLLLRLVG
ncbi:MAG: GNAT family N-acetyltransferase [bacterium]|nr:GNAT family N-acetyltransferase [bacterium]